MPFGKIGFKSFIGFKDHEKVKPLFIMLPKIIVYPKRFNKSKCMSFVQVSNTFKNGFES